MRIAWGTIRLIISFTLILLFIYSLWWMKPFRTAKGDSSMSPTYEEDQRVYFKRNVKKIEDVNSGDVILYNEYDSSQRKNLMRISRIVALPGQVVTVIKGQLTIDGQGPSGRAAQSGKIPKDYSDVIVPRGYVLVYDDYRKTDKRALYERFINISKIIGNRLIYD